MRSELFKTALQSYKDELAKCLQEGGEGKRISAFLEKIDHQIPLSQNMFDVAWQHQQSKVDELQKRVDAALERAGHACIGTAMFHKQFNDVIAILRGEQALKGGEP